MRTLITGGTIVNEGQTFPADIVIEDEKIVSLKEKPLYSPPSQ